MGIDLASGVGAAAMRRPGELDEDLRAAVRRVARTPHLLVACDYDGTIAPIVDDPTHAAPLPVDIAARNQTKPAGSHVLSVVVAAGNVSATTPLVRN